MRTLRICCFLLILGSLVAAPRTAEAVWGRFKVGGSYETGPLVFDELTEFTGFLSGGGMIPDSFETLRYELNDTRAQGFRIQLDLDPAFVLIWSRQSADTHYRVWRDGEEIFDNPSSDPPVQIGQVDVRVDTITLAYRPAYLEWSGIGPVLRVGYGWVLLSQRRPFRPTRGRLPVDYSDSDGTIEATLGLEARWRELRAGADLRTLHWRWDPGEVDSRVPGRVTHALQFSLWVGASF